MKPIIAYVDDDVKNLEFYRELLEDDFSVETYLRSIDLINSLPSKTFDCYIFDIYMPFIDGFQLFERITKSSPTQLAPVFFVTANPDDEVRVVSYQKGAADFFDRLIKKDELIARLKSRIKTHRAMSTVHKLGSLALDHHSIEVTLHSKPIVLTLIEFKILSKLLKSFPQRTSKEELMEHVWGRSSTHSNNLNSHLYNLRIKLTDWEYEISLHKTTGFLLVPINFS